MPHNLKVFFNTILTKITFKDQTIHTKNSNDK